MAANRHDASSAGGLKAAPTRRQSDPGAGRYTEPTCPVVVVLGTTDSDNVRAPVRVVANVPRVRTEVEGTEMPPLCWRALRPVSSA
jgi:hypothetical protein